MADLVAVVVVTYNSSEFVIETLESVKKQTYGDIELIISDDCSADDTVQRVSDWISVAQNKDRFRRVVFLTVERNTGISANCNRCTKVVSADWIKHIAGDDILLPNCIEDNMRHLKQNPDIQVLFSKVKVYLNTFHEKNYLKTLPNHFPDNIMGPRWTAADQHQLLLVCDRINFTPSYFFKKSAIESVDGYDEENRLMEDYPMWLKLTRAGICLYFMEKITVGYRQHDKALNNMNEQNLFKPLFLKSYEMKKKMVFPYLTWDLAANEKHVYWVSNFFHFMGMNKKIVICQVLYILSTVYLNPFRYVIYFKKRFLKLGTWNLLYS